MNYTVGQTLWYVPNRGQPFEVTIANVGRKWLTIDLRRPMRVDKTTLNADGGQYSSPGTCYLSESAYRDERELSKAWDDFTYWVCSRMPYGVTLEKIRAARTILKPIGGG
jgi:hypothetical protein